MSDMFGSFRLNSEGRQVYGQMIEHFDALLENLQHLQNPADFGGAAFDQFCLRLQEAQMWAAKSISLQPRYQEKP